MKISIGKITAPVGIKGELRVYPYIDDAAGFASIEKVEIDKKEYTLEKARMQKNMLVISLAEITDRNAAETFRSKEILVEKDELELDDGCYLDVDIVGMEVYSAENSKIGIVTNVLHNSAQDLYEITKTDGKTFLLPAVKAFVLDVDVPHRRMTVDLIDGIDEI